MNTSWPPYIPRPLFADHAAEILEVWEWSTEHVAPIAHERHAKHLVIPRCEECGQGVLEVVQPMRREGDGWLLLIGSPLLIGTERDPGADQIIKVARAQGERRVDVAGRWTAILDRVPTPTVPAYCQKCGGALDISVAELRRRARPVLDEDRDADTKMRVMLRGSSGT